VFEKVKKGEFTFDHNEFSMVSESAKDLIRRLLTVNKSKRFTCSQALAHNWFKEIIIK